MIRNPVELVCGAVRQYGISLPDSSSQEFYRIMDALHNYLWSLQMDILDPPNVAGWPAYYQLPDFYEIWINSTTLPSRGQFTDALVGGIRSQGGDAVYKLDPVVYVSGFSDPSDPFVLIDDIASDLLPPIKDVNPITPAQKDYLLYNVMGLVQNDEYEWTTIWNNALKNPPDQQSLNSVTNKLKGLFKFMMRMAEFQLI